MWEEKLAFYDQIVDTIPGIERKGKGMPYTSVNGHMFSLLNKAGEIGIRLSKIDGERFMEEHQTTRFKSHGAFMRGYVLIPEHLYENMELLTATLQSGYDYVMTLDPK